MNTTPVATWVLAIALLTLGACATPNSGTDPKLTIVPPPADLVIELRERLSRVPFHVGRYPENAKSIEDIYQYLSKDDSVRWLLPRWDRVYATEFAIEFKGKSGLIYVYASNHDFIGDLAYAVSIPTPVGSRQIYKHERTRK